MMAAEDLDGIRRPHFETLSNALITMIEQNSSSLAPRPSPLYRMHCPMVYGDRGADWLQDSSINSAIPTSALPCSSAVR